MNTVNHSKARKFFRSPVLWILIATVCFGLYAWVCIREGKLVTDPTAITGLVSIFMFQRVRKNP